MATIEWGGALGPIFAGRQRLPISALRFFLDFVRAVDAKPLYGFAVTDLTLSGAGHYPNNDDAAQYGCVHQPWRNTIIKIMVLLHSAEGMDWQSPPKGTSLRTLGEAEEQGFILIRGEFQKRQCRLTELGSEYVERDKRRLEARKH